ncbi:MAG: sulfatase [Verrucomicrobia bacterium]|nr:sulfatase [Verrucomicrobiota bacterium]
MKARHLLLLAAACFSASAMAQRPNIVIFHCHDMGQHIGCYGIKTVRTPNLDRLAQEGVRFARSFCTQPGCSSSRASLFTGRYPHNNGVMGLTHANFGWDLRPEEKHLAQFLKEAGYATVAIGNVHETRSGPARCGYEKFINKGKAVEATDAAVAELKRLAAGNQPFYLYAGLIEPHRLPYPKDGGPMSGLTGFPGPHLKPDDLLGVQIPGYLSDTPGTREELAGLQGAIKHVDEQFGRWTQALRELGLEKNTLLIATTDHGIAMPRAKCSVYEPGLQVILLLRHAGRAGWHGGAVRNEMVSNIDVLPSILDLIGIPVPANVQGRSFSPLLDGHAYKPNTAIFGELTYHGYYDPQRSIRTETHKLIANFSTAPAFQDPSQMWRPKSDTVVPENPATAFHQHLELYDLTADPWEQVNLASKPACASIRDELARRLLQHMKETDDPLLRGAVTSPQHETALKLLRGEPVERKGKKK